MDVSAPKVGCEVHYDLCFRRRCFFMIAHRGMNGRQIKKKAHTLNVVLSSFLNVSFCDNDGPSNVGKSKLARAACTSVFACPRKSTEGRTKWVLRHALNVIFFIARTWRVAGIPTEAPVGQHEFDLFRAHVVRAAENTIERSDFDNCRFN